MGRKAGGMFINQKTFGALHKPCMKEMIQFLNSLALCQNNDEKCVRQKELLGTCMDAQVDILKRELERTRAGLAVSDSKLKLKEELANVAMAAQSASEMSLHLADNRASILNQRIEELTRQLGEAEDREKKNKRKHGRICWLWRALIGIAPVCYFTLNYYT